MGAVLDILRRPKLLRRRVISLRVGWLIVPISDVVVGYFILAGLEPNSLVRAAPAG
jgi:hypothetical protein